MHSHGLNHFGIIVRYLRIQRTAQSSDALVTTGDGAQPLVLQDDQHPSLLPALGPRLLLQRSKSTSLLRTTGRQALYFPLLR